MSRPLLGYTHTWTGPATGGFWNNDANWDLGAPTSGEAGGGTIVNIGSSIHSVDNLAGLVVDQLVFTGTGAVVGGTTIAFGAPLAGGNILNSTGSNTLALPIALSGAQVLYAYVSSGTLTINGAISGNGGLRLFGATVNGALSLKETNSYTGTTTVEQGTLFVDSPTFNGAIPGSLVVGDGVGSAGTAVVRDLSGENISNSSIVTLGFDGLLDLNGFTETIDGLSGASGQVALGSGTLTLSAGSGTVTFGGSISGTGGVTKSGIGFQIFNGANAYTGPTTIQSGTLEINGSQVGSAVTVMGGALEGGGTVGSLVVQSGGLVAPGHALSTAGTLNSPSVTFQPGSTFSAVLNGTAANLYSRLQGSNMSVTIALNNATLSTQIGYVPVSGDSFTIVAANTVTGTFNGLPDGALFVAGGKTFHVDYQSSAVVLSVCQNAPSVTSPAGVTATQTLCQ